MRNGQLASCWKVFGSFSSHLELVCVLGLFVVAKCRQVVRSIRKKSVVALNRIKFSHKTKLFD